MTPIGFAFGSSCVLGQGYRLARLFSVEKQVIMLSRLCVAVSTFRCLALSQKARIARLATARGNVAAVADMAARRLLPYNDTKMFLFIVAMQAIPGSIPAA